LSKSQTSGSCSKSSEISQSKNVEYNLESDINFLESNILTTQFPEKSLFIISSNLKAGSPKNTSQPQVLKTKISLLIAQIDEVQIFQYSFLKVLEFSSI
jgi:hypothetical protein